MAYEKSSFGNLRYPLAKEEREQAALPDPEIFNLE